jgi:hypothetical protein
MINSSSWATAAQCITHVFRNMSQVFPYCLNWPSYTFAFVFKFDVRGSVHHSKIHTEITNKMQHSITTYYCTFKWGWTCFGRHTAHHQEPKTALAASGFAYVEGCWTFSLLDSDSVQQPQRPITSHVCKTRSASTISRSWWWAVCRPKNIEPHLKME